MFSMTVAVLGGSLALSKSQRLVVGLTVLILVDLIWVATSEFTKYFFSETYNRKPYFNTFVSCSMLAVYLAGFLLHRSWWYQCRKDNVHCPQNKDDDVKINSDSLLSDPVFVPIKFDKKYNDNAASSEAEDSSAHSRTVRFSRLSEVRQMSAAHGEEALLARLSYAAYMRAEECRLKAANKLTVRQISKIAGIFCFVLFFGQLSYQEALNFIDFGLVNILFSTSALFTLVLASVFPASNADRFTLSKFVAVALSIGGIVLMSWSTWSTLGFDLRRPLGVIWPILGALLLAIFLVMLRRRVDHEQKLNMPMFYGFLGFFTLVFLWPGLIILHFTNEEVLEWPDTTQWIVLAFNGIVGMVISNILWLWSCFFTSSLSATLSLTLVAPMSAIAGVFVDQAPMTHNWMFYVGVCPVFVAFFAVAALTHYDNCDPVLIVLKKTLQCVCRRRIFSARAVARDVDREQSESLIGVSTERMET